MQICSAQLNQDNFDHSTKFTGHLPRRDSQSLMLSTHQSAGEQHCKRFFTFDAQVLTLHASKMIQQQAQNTSISFR